jgi:deoxyxylulose-5-phosphate synthase
MLVNAPCLNKVKSQNPMTVRLPNGATIESTHTASLDIPQFKKSASIAKIFMGMGNQSLLSVGQLCNEGYSVTIRINAVTIYNSREVQVSKGARDLDTGLWRINPRKEHQQHPH